MLVPIAEAGRHSEDVFAHDVESSVGREGALRHYQHDAES